MKIDYIRKLRSEKKLLDHHVQAAAIFEKLVYSGYSSESLKLERVDGTPKYEPNLAGLKLGKLSPETSKILSLVIIHDKSLINIGYMAGAKSRRTAFRWGLDVLKYHLDQAYNVLC